jgi:hypothetical protein
MYHYIQFHHYKLMQERREREQRYLLTGLSKVNRASAWQLVIGRLQALFSTPGAKKQQRSISISLEAAASEEELLTKNGFSADQIAILYRLRRWHQMCNREHVAMLRHWEFLKRLVNSGKLEL